MWPPCGGALPAGMRRGGPPGAAGGDDTEYDYYMQRLRMFTSRYEKTLLIGDSMGDFPQTRSSCEPRPRAR